jgi:hypothetical protein
MPVADRGLGHLCDEGLRVTQKQNLQRTIAVESFLELPPPQSKRIAGRLHYRAARSGLTAHEQGDSDDALVPTTAISAEEPSSVTYRSDPMESVGK